MRLASQIFKAAAPPLKISHSALQSKGFPVPKESPPREPSLTGPDAWRLAPYQALLILQPPLCRLTSLPTSPLCVCVVGGVAGTQGSGERQSEVAAHCGPRAPGFQVQHSHADATRPHRIGGVERHSVPWHLLEAGHLQEGQHEQQNTCVHAGP